jgi:hypothetical protein
VKQEAAKGNLGTSVLQGREHVRKVRLTFPARRRFPDIGTHHGTAALDEPGGWHRVEWPGERTTWLRAEDIVPVAEQPHETL